MANIIQRRGKYELKKCFFGICLCLVLTLGFVTNSYAFSSSSANLFSSKKSAESDAIGLAKVAYAEVYNLSSKSVKVKFYAAWAGWPYTCEQTGKVEGLTMRSYTENQSKNSSFKLKLTSGGGVDSFGYIYCN